MEGLRWYMGGLLDLLQSYVYGCGRAAEVLCEEFGWGLSPGLARFSGVVVGLLVLAGFADRVRQWTRRGNQPQAFPLRTEDSPEQVLARDRSQFMYLVMRIVLLLIVLGLLIYARQ